MTEQHPMGEKDEKSDEKEMEKREEKSPEEKNWEEKYRRDPLGSIIWAVILIWVGLVFLASNLNLLNSILRNVGTLTGINQLDRFVGAWPIILMGMGVILLVEVVIRLLVPAYRRPITGTLILAVVFIGIGLDNLVSWSWNVIWPLILIVLGISFLMRGMLRRK